MPTTARVTINTNEPIGQLIDDVLNSSFGRGLVLGPISPAGNTPIPWPTTGETLMYMRIPQYSSPNTVVLKADPGDVVGWSFVIPAGTSFVPVIFPKPSTGNILVSATLATVFSIFFF